MQIRTITITLITAAVVLAAVGNAEGRLSSLHWTAKAAPGYQHILRTHNSPQATCHKRSAREIHCTKLALNSTASITLMRKTRALRVITVLGQPHASTVKVPRGWAA
jgi:hypothetical protein